jgi:putative (di)nucleoside polyphosphate hydrolase
MGDKKAKRDKKARKKPYRKGVGALLFNDQGKVFVGERLDAPGAWQLPQGGVDKGEKPRRAVLRELTEEIGTGKAEILAKSADWLAYDLPDEIAARVWGGRFRGQKQRWFALRFTGEDREIDPANVKHPEFVAWKWAKLEDIPRLIVGFKRPLYEALVAEFKPLARQLKTAARAKKKEKGGA